MTEPGHIRIYPAKRLVRCGESADRIERRPPAGAMGISQQLSVSAWRRRNPVRPLQARRRLPKKVWLSEPSRSREQRRMDEAGASNYSDQDGGGESGTEGAEVGLVVQSHGGRALKRAMIDDGQQAVWRQADAFQVAQHLRITIGHAAHNRSEELQSLRHL